MAYQFRKRKKVAEVFLFDGPTSAGGASMNTYVYEDETCETVESDWYGRTVARYDGEPRPVPPGMTMPPPPPRPAGAAPLPPSAGAPSRQPARPDLPPLPPGTVVPQPQDQAPASPSKRAGN